MTIKVYRKKVLLIPPNPGHYAKNYNNCLSSLEVYRPIPIWRKMLILAPIRYRSDISGTLISAHFSVTRWGLTSKLVWKRIWSNPLAKWLCDYNDYCGQVLGHTHAHTHTHTKGILRNQTCAWLTSADTPMLLNLTHNICVWVGGGCMLFIISRVPFWQSGQ